MIVFLDIDNTLVDLTGALPESARQALQIAGQNGHQLFISSGRSMCEIYPWLMESGLFHGIVAGAGAYARIGQETIWHRPIPDEKVQEMAAYFEEKKMDYMLQCNEGMYASDGAMDRLRGVLQKGAGSSAQEETEIQRLYRRIVFPIAGVSREIYQNKVNKALFFRCPDTYEQMQKDLPDFYVLPSSLSSSRDARNGEISEAGMSKAVGMQKVLDALHAGREDVMAVGDGPNDLEMLEFAGTGVAMGNAQEELKARADYVTTDISEDGIYHCFQHFGLLDRKVR